MVLWLQGVALHAVTLVCYISLIIGVKHGEPGVGIKATDAFKEAELVLILWLAKIIICKSASLCIRSLPQVGGVRGFTRPTSEGTIGNFLARW